MKYTDLSINLGFYRNMRETNWLKLFPHWWSENDPLIQSIGNVVEKIKAQAIFDLLNIGLKPPVLLWQRSLNHEKYVVEEEITDLPYTIEIPAPRYKTWGKITIKNTSDTELYNLKIMITEDDGIVIYDPFSPDDVLVLDLTEQNFYINNSEIEPQKLGEGLPYFKISQNKELTDELKKKWDPKIPLHNEIVRIVLDTDTVYNDIDLHVDVELQNAVFINEQNIEITSLELIPLDRVDLYAYYDFPFNKHWRGWRKVYTKQYEPETTVLYDMITVQFHTRKFYVDVWFKGLDFPYQVGFPCWRDEDEDSIYHINPRLDVWGEYLGLPRRLYKKDILEEDYYRTFPIFYEFDIEQDFWYYARLVNEYADNDLAIDTVNVLDTNENPVLRLHSINPFVEDFAIHARSYYPEEIEGVNYLTFIPTKVTQNSSEADYKQTDFENTFNLLKDDDYPTHTTLHNRANYAITNETYRSKELDMFFDLSSLPENVNIDGFEIIIDAEATDNNESKYNDDRTRVQIIDGDICLYEQNIGDSDTYELTRKNITYGATDKLFGMETVASNLAKTINQHAIIQELFQGTLGHEVRIPFEIIEDIHIDDIKIKYPSGLIRGGIYEDNCIHTILPNTYEINKEFIFGNLKLILSDQDDETLVVGVEVDNAVLDGEYEISLYQHNTNTDDENNDIIRKKIYIHNNRGIVSFDGIPNNVTEVVIENDKCYILYMLEDNVTQKSYKIPKKEYLEVMVTSIDGNSSFKIPYEIFPRTHRYSHYSMRILPTENSILYNRTDYDLRDILQKNGVHFIFALQNDDESNTPTIFIHNAYFRVYFSPKKTDFTLETELKKGNGQYTNVGQLVVRITNTGDKPLKTICNILPENNIKLNSNSINVDLEVGQSIEKEIKIEHQLPIIDGVYEIITICENKKKIDYVTVNSNGLIETSIDLLDYSTHYYKKINVVAKVNSIDNSIVDQGTVSFYIQNKNIGQANISNGKAIFSFMPAEHNIRGGMYRLEARYTDYHTDNNYIPKYSSSRSISNLLVNNEPTFIEILSEDYGFTHGNYVLKARVYNYSNTAVINEGTISFYLDDELVGLTDKRIKSLKVVNNIVEVSVILNYKKAGIYTLKAKYNDDESYLYGPSESTKEIILYGGSTETSVFDIDTYPGDTVLLKAHVQQMINSSISGKYSLPTIPETYYSLYEDIYGNTPNANKVTFKIDGVTIGQVNLNNDGNATLKYNIPLDILGTADEKICTITAYYEGLIVYQTQEDFNKKNKTVYFEESYGVGKLIISKKDTEIICSDIFSGSNYETLGFYVKVQEFGSNNPVKEGKVKLTIPDVKNISFTQPIEQDGGVRFVYHPVDFFDREWSALEKTTFKIKNIDVLDGEDIKYEDLGHLLREYDGASESDLDANDFVIRNSHLFYYYRKKSTGDIEVAKDIKQVYMYNGHLYAQTDSDIKTNDIIYSDKDIKTNVYIEYIPTERYKKSEKNSQIKITTPKYDVDLHSYEFDYSSKDPLRAWVTFYDWDKKESATGEPLTIDGTVYFYLDDIHIGHSKISKIEKTDSSYLAVIPHDTIGDIKANSHLLSAEYIPTDKKAPHTYAYNKLTLRKANSNINAYFDHILKDYDATLHIEVDTDAYDEDKKYGFLYGKLSVYLNDTLYDSTILKGTIDEGQYDCHIHIPNDIDEKDYIVRIEYEGNDYINSCYWQKKLEHQKLPVNIKTKNIYAIPNSTVSTTIEVSAIVINDEEEPIILDHDINEGFIGLYKGDECIISKKITHNKVKLEWDIGDVQENQEYQVKFLDGINYKNNDNELFIQKVIILSPLKTSYVSALYDDSVEKSDGTEEKPFTNLQEAFNCTETNGYIYIIDDCFLTQDIKIDRDIHIKGYNNSRLIKDFNDLFIDDNYFTSLKVYNPGDFDREIYEINDLKLSHLNTEEFKIIKNNLYYIQDNDLIPIFLLSNNKFYSYTPLLSSSINNPVYIDIKSNVTFDNVEFISKDNDKDFIIINNKELKIIHSIINNNITVDSENGILTINYSLVYGTINGNGDLSFNWWGYNNAPYDDNIVLQLKTDKYPPVIGEDFYIRANLVGKNGVVYNIPAPKYEITSDCEGYCDTPTGLLIDQYISVAYVDAIKPGNITIKVDEQELSVKVHNYDYKTEVILDDATEIPINYQIPIRAKVQSCADTYYKFDEHNNIIESSNNINEGTITFYIDNIQVGTSIVEDGAAEILVFFNNKYEINREYKLTAEYNDVNEHHYKSKNSKNIILFSEENSCFVSPNGNNYNDGTFNSPVKTIQQALSLPNVSKIYLKEGNYLDNNIVVNKDIHIKKYNGNVVFNYNGVNSDVIFRIQENKNVELYGLDFINNKCKCIVENSGNIIIDNCIFENNKCQNDIEAIINSTNNIYHSVLLDSKIINNSALINDLKFCWFGTNEPQGIIRNYTINDYIIMDLESDKEILYIGTIAHIKASLLKYVHNDKTYDYKESLPLRIATFSSDAGSLMPLRDYTHSNYAISLLNTNEKSNSQQIFIQYDDIENYVDMPITLQCSVTYSNGKVIDEGQVIFELYDGENYYTYYTDVHNGVAQKIIDDIILPKGEYPVLCSYTKNDEKFVAEGILRINHLSIIIEDIEILEGNYLNNMSIRTNNIVDSLGKAIRNQKVYIYIDNTRVYDAYGSKTFRISNGILNVDILYPLQKAGYHNVIISTDNLYSEYEVLNYQKKVLFTKKQTVIDFPYNKIQEKYKSDLTFNVYDSDGNIVIYGDVDVFINGNKIQEKSIPVINGQVTIPNFVIYKKGKYSISIYYHGDEEHYEDSLYIDNNINVGLHEVNIDESDIKKQLKLTIIDDINIAFNIFNITNDKIQQGHVKLYIDNVVLNNNQYIEFENELISYKDKMPQGIIPGKHIFTIAYEDTENQYIDTIFDIPFTVSKIDTKIIIDDIVTAPNKTIYVDYDVATSLGSALTGTLEATLDGKVIGKIDLTTDTRHKIPLNIPLINDNQTINYVYTDNTNYYQESTLSVPLIIEKENVNISTSYAEYYPNKDFDFTITVRDQEGKIINDGNITLYVDSIKQTTEQPLVNGQTNFILNLSQIKKYTVRILFSDNEYYKDTSYPTEIEIKKIPIFNINFEEELVSEPNTEFNNTLIFSTFENRDVIDGVVDFYLDNNKINSFYMTANNKDIRLDIPNLNAGTYTLGIKYHNSNLFSNFEDFENYKFKISAMNIEMHMDDITARLNDTISINCNVTPDIKGLIKYSMGINENNLKFIGLKEINRTYDYTLSKDLQENNEYIIIAHFDGNDQYAEQETQCKLYIEKQDATITLDIDSEVIYQDYLHINGETNINGNPPIDLYIDGYNGKRYIDTVIAENNEFSYKYKLPAQYIENEYSIIAEYQGSPVINNTSSTANFNVIKDTPRLHQSSISIYKGNSITLENVLYDVNEINIKSGTLEYYYGDQLVLKTDTLNNKETLIIEDIDWSKDEDILVAKYIPNQLGRYNETEYNIDLIYKKNNININMDIEYPPLRGEKFEINIHVTSDTTSHHINVNAQYKIKSNNDFEINNGFGKITNAIIPNTFSFDECKIEIRTIENDIFNESNITFDIPISYLDTIYVNKNSTNPTTGKTEETAVKNIETAYNLLNQKGTIILLSDLNNNSPIDIEKNITIQGNSNTLYNFTFNNNGVLKANDTTFNHSHISNEGSIEITDCIMENSSSNIVTNNKAVITNTIFRDNNTEDSGPCVYINTNNKYTLIDNCYFNNNSATKKGGCIESNQGNDLVIQNSTFTNNKTQYIGGSCISINGNANINHNLFMKNTSMTEGQITSDILLLTGFIESEVNIFDGSIIPIKNNMGKVIANMSYWGQNDKNNAINILDNDNYTNEIEISTWLISEYKKERIFQDDKNINRIYPIIKRYRNEDEYDLSEFSGDIPSLTIEYNNDEYKVNEDYIETDESIYIQIGQEIIEAKYD